VGEEHTGREAIELGCPVRVNIIVEGQTEETFVNKILAKELGLSGISISARSVETKRKKSRFDRSTEIKRGGLSKYDKAKKDIQRWRKEDRSAYLTTMFDLYALAIRLSKVGRSKAAM